MHSYMSIVTINKESFCWSCRDFETGKVGEGKMTSVFDVYLKADSIFLEN